jgi:pyruvate-ferredoxin/flavodoxin oxidoreductase
MKDAATKSYLKKGQDIVDMNHRAIDAGATAYVKVDVPAEWADTEKENITCATGDYSKLTAMVKNIMEPIARMDGDSLPVSAFVGREDGTFEQGAAAFEKRGVAVTVPTWDTGKCIQCNQCAYVCPHATIRPFALTGDELAAAPKEMKAVPFKAGKGKGIYNFAIAVSPLDCMGCGVCAKVCPAGALTMGPREDECDQQLVFDYAVANIPAKGDLTDATLKGSQFVTPLLEFSGSCAGCAETAYGRLITQVCGDRMYIANATGCSSIWGGPAATSPYTVNKKKRPRLGELPL